MKTLHLFAGAGGGIIADMMLGHTPVAAVEIDPFCREVLKARQRDGWLPEFEIFEDVRDFNGKDFRGKVDCICGGFPCQDISCAGKGEGIHGERSGLFFEMARIVREARPGYVFMENSPNIVCRGIEAVLWEMDAMGYDARWCVLSAAAVGALHRRDRWWGLFANSASARRETGGDREGDGEAHPRPECVRGEVPNACTWKAGGGSHAYMQVKKLDVPDEEKRILQSGGGGAINPDWVEWLMGWPPGWTDPETPLRYSGPPTNGESRESCPSATTGGNVCKQ